MVEAATQRQAEEIRRRLIESSQDAIVGKDLNGIIVSWNQAAELLFGYTAEEAVGLPISILIPAERLAEETIILDHIRRGIRVDHYETVRRCKNGNLVDISLSISPIKDEQGNIIGASKIARDITTRKRAEEKNQLVLREINHRVKNLFSLASGMLSLSARSAESPAELAAAVRDRLAAMARTQELILPDLTEGAANARAASLAELTLTILSPFDESLEPGESRVRIEAPEVTLGAGAVTNLALLLHELATNAAKYGALSVPAGQLDILWTIDADRLHLDWTERGGPLPIPPTQEGFGSVLIGRIVRDQFGGQIDHHWNATGLAVSIALPLAALKR